MQLDLNLLTALDALLEEGSVAGAAARLQVSSPAMSRTLGRIRRATGDQILVRTGRTMTATPHAVAIRAQVHALVQQAQAVLAPQRSLDLAVLERTFTLKWHDALTSACGPVLLAAVRSQAPGVRLRFVAEASTDTPDLRRGEVDLEAGSNEPALPEIHHENAGHDHLVIAVRPGHPLTDGPLTPDRYAAAHHITVSRRGRLSDPIDDALAAQGLRRHVVAAAPTAAAALQLVGNNDLVVAVPGLISRSPLAGLGLRTLPLPLDMPAIPIHLAWHQRYDGDRAHAWLRDQARTAIHTVCRPPARPETER
ncbi:LysR family transcriptional regulator [Streptomyces sp. AK02-01A]|uniref:LysR family transcriptional regulator n=1 Tax=Streptomyces sp. AK02-01A TaxID=3028648 RepID=UPI0029A435B1|nr:LysR family transcriptional regulator [Streptomyces sp. AK02-01A]MDX3852357.1 LysR family transcriptional regulator [Streptomyces sp. AK02-01A]